MSTVQQNANHISNHRCKPRQVTRTVHSQSTHISTGLGRGLVSTYLLRPNHTVVAAVRDPSHPTSKTLSDLPKGSDSSLIVVQIDSASNTDAAAAISSLRSTHHISSIDVVIANAGVAASFPRVEEAQPADLLEHYRVNTIGVVVLFREVLPLLGAGAKFVAMGTSAAMITEQEKVNVPNAV